MQLIGAPEFKCFQLHQVLVYATTMLQWGMSRFFFFLSFSPRSEICIHGLGAAINRAIHLALSLEQDSHGLLGVRVELPDIELSCSFLATSHDFFSLRFSYNFGTVGKRGTILAFFFSKFEVDPSKEVELEQREVGRLSEKRAELERSAAWHNRCSDRRRVHVHVCRCCIQDHRS